jgi:hypothetical protein
MFVRLKIPGFNANPSGHAEMNPEPAPNVFASPDYFGVMAREFEEHPFAARFRAQKFFIDQYTMKFVGICSPKNQVSPMKPNIDNLLAEAGVPLLAIPLDLSQFGHRAGYTRELLRQSLLWGAQAAGL